MADESASPPGRRPTALSISGLPDSSVTTTGDSAPWLPPQPPTRPATPQQHSPTAPRQQRGRREGAAGGIVAGMLAFLKYGLFLVKFGTFGPTLITMVIAIWFYTLFFGPAFAVGIVALILVHELGHFIVARWMGLPARLPIFVGPLGAVTNLRRAPADAGKSGIIALAGPALGTVAALLCFLLAETASPRVLRATCSSRSRTSAASSTSST